MAKEDESTLDTILSLKHRDPFQPFMIVMTSRDRYWIDDPDSLAIGSSQLHYYPRTDKAVHMRLNQIASVEEFDQKPPTRKRKSA